MRIKEKPKMEDTRTLKEKLFDVPKKYSLIIRDLKKFGTSIEIAFSSTTFYYNEDCLDEEEDSEDDFDFDFEPKEYPFMEFFGMAMSKFFSEYEDVKNLHYSVLYSKKGVSLYLEYDGNMTKYKTEKIVLECLDKILNSNLSEIEGKTIFKTEYLKKAISDNERNVRYHVKDLKNEIIKNGAYFASYYLGSFTNGKNTDKLREYDFNVYDVMEPASLSLNFIYDKPADEKKHAHVVANTICDLLRAADVKNGKALEIDCGKYENNHCKFKGDDRIDTLQIYFEMAERYSKKITAFILIKYINEMIASDYSQLGLDKEKSDFVKENKNELTDMLLTVKALLLSPDLKYCYYHVTGENDMDFCCPMRG